MKKLFALPLLCLFLSTGCASFHPNPTPNLSLDKFQYKETEKGVTVAIDPYFAPIKTQAIFDNDFEDHEMLALLLHTSVPDGDEYAVTRKDITIGDGAGKVFKPVGYKEAGQCVGRGYGYSVLWFLGTGFPGLFISAIHTASVNINIENDLKAREFQCGPLKTKDCQGFLYYNLEPYKHKTPQEMKANITVENIKTKEPINFNITFAPTAGWYGEVMPLKPLKDSPAKAAPPAQSVMGI